MGNLPQYLILIGGIGIFIIGIRKKNWLDLLIGVCFSSSAGLQLSHLDAELPDAVKLGLSLLIVLLAGLKLRDFKKIKDKQQEK